MSFGYKQWLYKKNIHVPPRTASRYHLQLENDAIENDLVENPVDFEVRTVHDEPMDAQSMELDPIQKNDDSDRDLDQNSLDKDSFEASDDENISSTFWLDDLYNFSKSKNPKNLKELMESEEISEKINVPVNKTRGEIMLMALKYAIHNELSMSAIINLFKLINTVFSNPILPDSGYMLDKFFNSKNGLKYYVICYVCSADLSNVLWMDKKITCPICKAKNDKNKPNKYCYFILLDPSEQIIDLLKNNEEYFDRVTKELRHEPNILYDIYDGIKYREFYSSLSLEERKNYLSAVFNTDGAAKFKCSKQSVWPLYLMINELPIKIRTKHLVVCGLIFGPHKPDMTIFLDKFVDLINTIRIPCTINNEERLLKIYILTCCVDAVARAPIQGIKQFNGHYGCSWCLHPGVTVGVKRFPILRTQPKLREHDEMISLMLEADSKNPKFGVMFPSPLMNLPQFDVVEGFIPDYMHMALEGVGKQFSSYHLDHLSLDKYEELDELMLSISVPLQIARRTRKITDRQNWKAREWENFILYYSPVIFSLLLTEDLMEHWLLFVESLYIIISDKIDVRDLDKADEMLHKFVAKIGDLYDVTVYTYNVHQLLHICKSVLNWGPAWCNSTFCFESANHYVLKSIKCAKGASEQVIRFIKMSHSLMVLEEKIMKIADDSVVQYCEDTLMSRTRCVEEFQKCLFFNPTTEDDPKIKSLNIPTPPGEEISKSL